MKAGVVAAQWKLTRSFSPPPGVVAVQKMLKERDNAKAAEAQGKLLTMIRGLQEYVALVGVGGVGGRDTRIANDGCTAVPIFT